MYYFSKIFTLISVIAFGKKMLHSLTALTDKILLEDLFSVNVRVAELMELLPHSSSGPCLIPTSANRIMQHIKWARRPNLFILTNMPH